MDTKITTTLFLPTLCFAIALGAGAFTTPVYAQDIRAKVLPASSTNHVSDLIDLSKKTIFGIPLGTSEDEVIAKFGPATGYARINGRQTVVLYGRSVGLLFNSGKLAGVRLTGMLLDYRLANEMKTQTPFDDIQWKLSNGIPKDSSLADVKRLLGSKLQDQRYNIYFMENGLRVDLDIHTFSSNGETPDQTVRRIGGILIQ
ncbi:MAG: hypothetical protein RSD57_05145 [Comamonas sp.]